MTPTPSKTQTRGKIIGILKQNGPNDANWIANKLNVSGMAIRQHLYILQEEGLVTFKEEPRAMGRPAKLWYLTDKSDHLFPEGYTDLSLSCIQAIKDSFGEEGLQQVLDQRKQQLCANYREKMNEKQSLRQQLEILATLRTMEGYMAEIEDHPENGYLLIEKHCPICIVAQLYPQLCQSEIETFQDILGDNVSIQRTKHIMEGKRQCAYHIQIKHK